MRQRFLRWLLLFTVPIMGKDMHQHKIVVAGIPFRIIENGSSPRRYIWIHGDEQTAKMALENHMDSSSGKAFLIQNQSREITIYGRRIDPNRIFSREGAKRNFHKYNPRWTNGEKEKVLDKIEQDLPAFLTAISPPDNGLIVSLHNNLRGYSIDDEIPLSDAVSIKPGQSKHDFYICTNREDFKRLAASPFNVVLQQSLPNEDDGSLSWWAVKENIRYVNIEVRLGWLSIQNKMLATLEEKLR